MQKQKTTQVLSRWVTLPLEKVLLVLNSVDLNIQERCRWKQKEVKIEADRVPAQKGQWQDALHLTRLCDSVSLS